MKLLLTSTGMTNETIKNKFIGMVGKQPEEMSLAYIPTAINVSDKPDKRWAIDNIVRLDAMGIGNLDIIDFSAIPKELWLPRLESVDVIFVEGGNPSYLISQMKKSGFADFLQKYTGLYVGCSAGSNVLGEVVIKSSKEAPGYSKEEGFGLINFSIRPHFYREDRTQFSEELVAELAKKYRSDFYAIDDNSAIAVEGGNVMVVSEGRWKKFDK